MHFMLMHKNDPRTEAGEPPPIDVVHEMGAFIGEHVKAGRFKDGAGLAGSKTRTRMIFRDGQCRTTHGPYAGERELATATHLLKVKTREEAIAWAERYGRVLGSGEIELGKVNEPWDIGLIPEPPNPPLQMLLVEKADHETEAGRRSSEKKAALTRLKNEMKAAGVLVRSIDLMPSSQAKRLVFKNNDLRLSDGPFAESKEMLGGFAVLDLATMDEAVEACRTYAKILGGSLEMDIRVVDTDAAA